MFYSRCFSILYLLSSSYCLSYFCFTQLFLPKSFSFSSLFPLTTLYPTLPNTFIKCSFQFFVSIFLYLFPSVFFSLYLLSLIYLLLSKLLLLFSSIWHSPFFSSAHSHNYTLIFSLYISSSLFRFSCNLLILFPCFFFILHFLSHHLFFLSFSFLISYSVLLIVFSKLSSIFSHSPPTPPFEMLKYLKHF